MKLLVCLFLQLFITLQQAHSLVFPKSIIGNVYAATPFNTSSNILSSTSSSKDIVHKVNRRTIVDFVKEKIRKNWFLTSEIAAIIIAATNPTFGMTGGPLKPEFFFVKVGVFIIFFLNGFSLSLDELKAASTNWKLNVWTQAFSLGIIPLIYQLILVYFPFQNLRPGLVCLSALPCTISMCITLTIAANANSACAVFNALFGNLLGIFLSPMIIIAALGATAQISFVETLKKLVVLVIFPMFIGQCVRLTPLKKPLANMKAYTRALSELILVSNVLNTFSDSFHQGIGLTSAAASSLFVMIPALYLLCNTLYWHSSRYLFPDMDMKDLGAAMICSSQKTLAFGIPLITTMFGRKAEYLAPLLVYSPTQLTLASLVLVPFIQDRIREQQERRQENQVGESKSKSV